MNWGSDWSLHGVRCDALVESLTIDLKSLYKTFHKSITGRVVWSTTNMLESIGFYEWANSLDVNCVPLSDTNCFGSP